jgi:hypothetical protein
VTLREAPPTDLVAWLRRVQGHAWSLRRMAMVEVLMREAASIDGLETGAVVLHLGAGSVAWDVVDTHGKERVADLVGLRP